jgi:alpha-1,3-mannosyltransferase
LDLYQTAPILPQLLGSIIEAIRVLGPQNCALSIVEGRSTDGTFEILSFLAQDLDKLGLKYYFKSNDIDPHGSGQRIQTLADLRNIALSPLIEDQAHFSDNTTVIFLNDVIACPDDILELIHQRVFQKADMTCAMDWAYLGPNPTFYDVWIARGMTGDTFFSIPEDGNWNSAWNLFWNDELARSRLGAFRPFQVFSCWNGGVAFTAAPILSGKIKFRVHNEGYECFQGEPKLFCKDMWVNGFGRIAVVPSVNFEYTTENGRRIKELKGFVQRWTENEGDVIKIGWQEKPPEQVKCMPNYNNQQWKKWDEGLPES